jgi:hypothetical protein
MTSADNLHDPSGNNALSQAHPAVQGITQKMSHSTMNPLPFLRVVTAMANLATATSADRETVATFTKAIATLTEQLKVKDIWAKSQEAQLKRLLGAQGNATPIVSTGSTNA